MFRLETILYAAVSRISAFINHRVQLFTKKLVGS